MKPALRRRSTWFVLPAAFGRLRVETYGRRLSSGIAFPAAFGRLRVETNVAQLDGVSDVYQPPSGGCVLKPQYHNDTNRNGRPAAFGRLRVETYPKSQWMRRYPPAAFRRLCVETVITCSIWYLTQQPPSGGCVLKPSGQRRQYQHRPPAAFGRLYVETVATSCFEDVS